MNKAHTGIEFGMPLILLESLVILPRIGEVVNRRNSMHQVIEGALQGKPVVVFRLGAELTRFERFHPTRQRRVLVNVLVSCQAAKSALRKMAMRRNKSRENKLSLSVISGPRSGPGWRVAFADGFDLAVIAHQDVAHERCRLSRLHGQICAVHDEQLIDGQTAEGKQGNDHDNGTKPAPSTGRGHALRSSCYVGAID